jgi:hypothetical protein
LSKITAPNHSSILRLRLLPFALILVGGSLIALLGFQFPMVLTILLIACIALLVFFKYPRWLIYVLAASIPFQDEIFSEQLSGARLTPETLGATLLILLFLIRGLLPGLHARQILRIRYLYLIVVFLLLSSLAIAIGPTVTSPAQGFWAVYRMVWVAPLIYFGVWIFLRDTKTLRQALAWLAVGVSFGAFIAMIQTITGGNLLAGIGGNYRYLGFLNPLPPEVVSSLSGKYIPNLYVGGTRIFRGFGTFYTSNGLGVLLCVAIFITWGLSASGTGNKRWLWIGLLGIQILGLFATFSRSAWAAGVAGGVVFLLPFLVNWIKHPIRMPKVLFASLVLLCLSLPFILANQNIRKRLLTIFTPTQVAEFNWRVAIWDYAGKQILQHPILGVGTSDIDNTVVHIHDPNTIDTFSTHNIFYDLAYQRGLINLTLYILFWIYYFRSAWKLYKEKTLQSWSDQKLILGLMAGGVAYIVSGIGIASMTNENLATLFWFLLGIVITWERFSLRPKLPPLLPSDHRTPKSN